MVVLLDGLMDAHLNRTEWHVLVVEASGLNVVEPYFIEWEIN